MTQTSFSKLLRPGEKWSACIGKGKSIRFSANGDRPNVSVLVYNSLDRSERFTAPDSLKIHHTVYLTKGAVLLSESGRAMASITEDTTGWIDAISGFSTREETDRKYGKLTYQEKRNDMTRCGEENFAVELKRNGLSMRDMVPCLNLFSKVTVAEDGSLRYDEATGKNGDVITFRTEMDIILIVSNTPNPYDPGNVYDPAPVTIDITDAPVADEKDPVYLASPENMRAFRNTWDYRYLMGR